MMEDSMRKRRCTYIKHHIYIKNWVIMLYSRNWHSCKSTIIKINLKKRIEVLPFSFFFWPCPYMWKFLGQGLNPHHCSENARSLTCCTPGNSEVLVFWNRTNIFELLKLDLRIHLISCVPEVLYTPLLQNFYISLQKFRDEWVPPVRLSTHEKQHIFFILVLGHPYGRHSKVLSNVW